MTASRRPYDLRRVKKVPHPLIEAWAKKHYELEEEIRKTVQKMTDEELQALKHAASSLTMANCWFAEYDVQPLVEEVIQGDEIRRRGLAAMKESRGGDGGSAK